MGNASGRELSQAERGRRPNDKEMLVLFKMQRALFHRLVASPEHLQLLQRYWTASFRRRDQMPGFVLVSDLWTEAGFSDPNPAADLNPMGELGLQCLVFFVETYPAETAMMRRGRGGYPFAKAAVAIVRCLSLTTHLMDAAGNPGPFPVSDELFWQLFERDDGFFQLFALAFLTFEELYCEEVAANLWMRDVDACSTAVVDKLVAAVELKLTGELKKAPLKLADLQDLCSNGRHIAHKKEERGSAALGASRSSTSSGEASSVGESWGKEQTKEKVAEPPQTKAYRLKPRMPEIERPASDSSQASGVSSDAGAQSPGHRPAAEECEDAVDEEEDAPDQAASEPTEDLFAGLVTKSATSFGDSKRNEHVAELETPVPAARSC
ncbi:Ran-binding protein 9/10 [Phytophthora cinnamomi]|uniref:Ran-binding protein 9/10 n=1 Tax=Phytophthora cinnamomi TaxID=4785 RepID=UPI003559D59C|nr:Ran-binding protein 9/10 [Phytophthora cinnamomi]